MNVQNWPTMRERQEQRLRERLADMPEERILGRVEWMLERTEGDARYDQHKVAAEITFCMSRGEQGAYHGIADDICMYGDQDRYQGDNWSGD